jgi:serine/threonine-protein kinase RsbW
MTLRLHATPQEVMRAVEALQDYARAHKVPDKTAFGLALALEECGSNVVNHALRHDPQQTFQVRIGHTGAELFVELRDPGTEFDPTSARGKKPLAGEDDLPGGWGIDLALRYADEVRYQRDAGENVLRLTKRLQPQPQ